MRAAWAAALLLLAVAFPAAARPTQVSVLLTLDGNRATFEHGGRQWRAAPAGAEPEAPATECEKEDEVYKAGSKKWIVAMCVSLACLLVAACAAGLTISVSGLNGLRLQIIERVAEKYEQMYDEDDELDPQEMEARADFRRQLPTVKKLLPIVCGPKNKAGVRGEGLWYWSPHGLLVSLLLANAAANEILPLYLDHLLPHWAVIIVSISLVLIFGEILPSALFSSDKMLWADRLYFLVQSLRFLTWPISLPIAKLLDRLLGHSDDEQMRKEELRALIQMHKKASGKKVANGSFAAAIILRPDTDSGDFPPAGAQPPAEEIGWAEAHRAQFPRESLTEARFARATYSDLVRWLEQVSPPGNPPVWQVDQEPQATERRGQGTDRAWVSFRTAVARDHALEHIQSTQRRLFGWIRVMADPCACEEAEARFNELDHYEVEIMTAALDLDQKMVRNEMSADLWALGHLDVLDQALVDRIFQSGYSRIPVFNVHESLVSRDAQGNLGFDVGPTLQLLAVSGPAQEAGFLAPGGWVKGGARKVVAVDSKPVRSKEEFERATQGSGPFLVRVDERDVIRGVLLVKSLALAYAVHHERHLERVADRCLFPVSIIAVQPTDNLHQVLQAFQTRKRHLALVTNKPDAFESCWKELDVDIRGEEERTPLTAPLPEPGAPSVFSGLTGPGARSPGTGRRHVHHKAVQALREADASVFGVLSLEDVIEELVGDIDDEFDARNQAKEERRRERAKNRAQSWHAFSHGLETRQRGASGNHEGESAAALRRAGMTRQGKQGRNRAHSTTTGGALREPLLSRSDGHRPPPTSTTPGVLPLAPVGGGVQGLDVRIEPATATVPRPRTEWDSRSPPTPEASRRDVRMAE
eukprot:TRINITY_DN3107_c1_g1_i1.p1 TRINITY_DN3107_c1_g1~~TRINITY_DN3107_c1_g1_i1.p1  ORF type:complete len:869 (+),score=284.53 TRINITY_DN3107_c1_g1_i1:110-2716(+)